MFFQDKDELAEYRLRRNSWRYLLGGANTIRRTFTLSLKERRGASKYRMENGW